jgi:hypothetical protein
MRYILSHTGVLFIATGLILCGIAYGGRLTYDGLQQLSGDITLEKSLGMIRNQALILREQASKKAEIEQALARIDRSKKPVHSHLGFIHYLEKMTRQWDSRIIRLPQENQSHEGEYLVSEASFQVEGTLNSILKLIYQLEQIDRMGNIRYTRLETQKIRRGNQRKQILLATIVLKRIIPSKHENPVNP